MITLSKSKIDEFLSKVEVDEATGCHNFVGHCNPEGYGQLYVAYRKKGKHTERAHRIAWSIAHGEVPECLCVLHTCDNPSCVNPEHLYLGTNADNMKDKADRERIVGERNPNAKLTERQVLDVLKMFHEDKCTIGAIAREYAVGHSTIGNIVKGRRWKHIYKRFMEVQNDKNVSN